MIKSSRDLTAREKITGNMALQYVEMAENEIEVLAHFLGIDPSALMANPDRAMEIWKEMGDYDLGRWCLAWLSSTDQPMRMADILTIMRDSGITQDSARKWCGYDRGALRGINPDYAPRVEGGDQT